MNDACKYIIDNFPRSGTLKNEIKENIIKNLDIIIESGKFNEVKEYKKKISNRVVLCKDRKIFIDTFNKLYDEYKYDIEQQTNDKKINDKKINDKKINDKKINDKKINDKKTPKLFSRILYNKDNKYDKLEDEIIEDEIIQDEMIEDKVNTDNKENTDIINDNFVQQCIDNGKKIIVTKYLKNPIMYLMLVHLKNPLDVKRYKKYICKIGYTTDIMEIYKLKKDHNIEIDILLLRIVDSIEREKEFHNMIQQHRKDLWLPNIKIDSIIKDKVKKDLYIFDKWLYDNFIQINEYDKNIIKNKSDDIIKEEIHKMKISINKLYNSVFNHNLS